jgi:FLVCR family feline leukemia virus subgroup C receptor-related protein
MMVGFSAVTPLMIGSYEVSTFSTTLLVLVFHVLYVPFNFPANYIIDRWGLWIPTLIGSACFIFGSWVRILVMENKSGYFWIVIGQTIAAIGMAFMISAPPKVANVWFGDKERSIATTIGSLASPVGNVLGFVLPLWFFVSVDKNTKWTVPLQEKVRGEFKTYILYQNIIITVCCVPILFLMRNKPKIPPSITGYRDTKAPLQFCNNFKVLMTSKNFLMIMGSFSLCYSIYSTLGGVVGPLTGAFGFDSKDTSIFGVVFIVMGLAGSFTHAIILDKYKRFKFQYMIILISSSISLCGLVGTLL